MSVTVTRDPAAIQVAPRPQRVEVTVPARSVTFAAQGPQGPPGEQGPPGVSTRATASLTTPSIAATAMWTGTIALGNGYRLYRVTTDAPCRVRLYTTDGKRTADASRPIGTDPVGDHGLILEFVSTASLLAADLSPLVDGFDGKAIPDGLVPISITNTGTGAAALTVTFTYIREEG